LNSAFKLQQLQLQRHNESIQATIESHKTEVSLLAGRREEQVTTSIWQYETELRKAWEAEWGQREEQMRIILSRDLAAKRENSGR
jgi:hypothetical protein